MDRLSDYSLSCNIVVSACCYLQWSNPSTPAYSRPIPLLIGLTTLQPSPRVVALHAPTQHTDRFTDHISTHKQLTKTPHKDKFTVQQRLQKDSTMQGGSRCTAQVFAIYRDTII